MAGKPTWTDAQIDALIADCEASETATEAAQRASARLGRQISTAALRHVLLNRRGLMPPVKAASKPPVDLLERRREKLTTAQQRSATEDLISRLDEAEKRNAFLARALQPTPPLSVVRRQKRPGRREGCAYAVASDWHVEERVVPESCGYRNAYDLTVADARIRRFFDGVIWLILAERAKFEINDAVLSLLGDLITGYIHEELLETNELAPVEAIRWLMPRARHGIKRIVDETDVSLRVTGQGGNHGRLGQKIKIKTYSQNSIEWLMCAILADEFAADPVYSKKVSWNVTPSAHLFTDIYDFCLHTHHGDSIKYQGGIGGLSVPLNKRVFKWDKAFIGGPSKKPQTYHAIGHFHQLGWDGHTLRNGSLIGYGDYSAWIGADFEPPQQTFCIFDSRHGVTAYSPIWVEENAESKRTRAA